MRRTLAILLLTCLTPVFSAGAQDTVRHRIIEMWKLSPDQTEELKVPFDTTFSLFHQYRLADKYSPLNASPGSYGLPFYQLNFFDRVTDPDKYLGWYYYPFMYQPGNYLFMNTQVPFTELVWTYGGLRDQAEQTFRIRHSQNVNRKLNFALVYDIVYNLGQYNYQQSSDKSFAFNGSYRGDNYKAYFAYGLNNIKTYENGGISDLSQLETLEPKNIAVNLGGLSKALSYLKNSNLMLVQRYTLGKKTTSVADSSGSAREPFWLSGSFSHILMIDGNRRSYEDNNPDTVFYGPVYISGRHTFDSLSARTIKNTIRFDFTTRESGRFRLAGGVGIRNELIRYSQIVPTHDTLVADTAVWRKHNNVLVGRLYNNIGDKFYWLATGELFLSGYRFGDFNLDGVISKSFSFKKGLASWNINGSIANRQPSFWYEQWGGNHFEWSKSMNKEFRIDVGSSFNYPARGLELRFNYAIIDNYTAFDTLAMPSQHGGGLSVASVFASKDLRAWKFHLTPTLLVQQSSNPDVLDLPLATVRATAFFEHLFNFKKTNGQLNMQLGAEVLYHTPYHALAYMPATGRYYRQNAVEIGNYPFVNVFLNLKLRRTRIFLMLDHVNSGFTGYDYFMIPFYPMNIRMFRYGLAWTFYD